ncbi:MAG TPA: DUF1684 domain-containing protein [Casimicrobiaceae bacterium]|nr:DUF1684 domain-containing protein [Casimicrobiaceae bacterium]
MATQTLIGALLLASSVGTALASDVGDVDWRADVSAWRTRADEGLRRERGWLSIIGRWELEPGSTSIGSDAGNAIRLPAALSPARLGTLEVRDGKAVLTLVPGQAMQAVDKNQPGASFTKRELLAGKERIEWVTSGRLSLQLVKRDDGRFVLRAADAEAPSRTSFKGRVWYEPLAGYRVPARFVPSPNGTKIPIVNVRGEVSDEAVAGHVEFKLAGQTHKLDALDDEGNLFIIFGDKTGGVTTYPPGRFLWIKKPSDGRWEVDFNKAYNPPCAFSAYTTCPLPPPQNVLDVAIPAGERYVELQTFPKSQ